MIRPLLKRGECRVFFDFDNTITTIDVLDDLIARFSVNQDWMVLEEQWRQGKIGSKACLVGQLALVRITRPALVKYLMGIKLDPHFPALLSGMRARGIDPVIVSDNFFPLIKIILAHHGIRGIKICANDMHFQGDKFILSFPHGSDSCTKCAHCKKLHVHDKRLKDASTVYIGDGLSDVCAAAECEVVFAKDHLAHQLKKIGKDYIPLKDLSVVDHYFKEAFDETKN